MRRPRAYAASKSGFRRKRRWAGRVSRVSCVRPGGKGTRTRLESGDELPAALGATTAQHLAAIPGGHASAKAMRALTAQLAWLIRTLHGGLEAPGRPAGKGRQG